MKVSIQSLSPKTEILKTSKHSYQISLMESPFDNDPSVIKNKAIISTFWTFPENLRKYIAHVKPRY